MTEKAIPPHPPFEPGNDVAVKHGAYSEKSLAPRADEILVELRQMAPKYQECDEPMLRMYARLLARIELVHAWLDENGLFKSGTKAVPQPILDQLVKWENLALRLANAFGLSPMSRMELRAVVRKDSFTFTDGAPMPQIVTDQEGARTRFSAAATPCSAGVGRAGRSWSRRSRGSRPT